MVMAKIGIYKQLMVLISMFVVHGILWRMVTLSELKPSKQSQRARFGWRQVAEYGPPQVRRLPVEVYS